MASAPLSQVTQMENYFLLREITNDLMKIHIDVLHLDIDYWKSWKWKNTSHHGYIA